MKYIGVLRVFLFIVISISFLFPFFITQVRSVNVDPESLETEKRKLGEGEMLISFFPLSVGEATLIQFFNRDTYLIDTGSKESSEELTSLLNQHGIHKIQGIFLTNACEEHIGGLKILLEQFEVESIYVPELTYSTYPLSNLTHIPIHQLSANDEWDLYPNVKITVMGPNEPLSLSPQVNSLVFQLSHQEIQFLFTGDIDLKMEERLIRQFPLSSEILKVSDFGSNFGSNPSFISAVDPQIGIIFSSDPDLYQISDDVLERLRESWVDVYMPKKQGEVQILSNGIDYEVEVIKNEEES